MQSEMQKLQTQDGKVGLGKGAVGPELKYRKKIVQTEGVGEHKEIDLPEEACDTMFENALKLRTEFLEEIVNPSAMFLSRENSEAGEKVASTYLTKEIFETVWGVDHSVAKRPPQVSFYACRSLPCILLCTCVQIDSAAARSSAAQVVYVDCVCKRETERERV